MRSRRQPHVCCDRWRCHSWRCLCDQLRRGHINYVSPDVRFRGVSKALCNVLRPRLLSLATSGASSPDGNGCRFYLSAGMRSRGNQRAAFSRTQAVGWQNGPRDAARHLAFNGGRLWVKSGKARSEHIPSGLPPKADIVDAFWDFRFVPKSEVTYSIVSSARASHSSTPYGPRVRTAALRRYGLVKTLHRAAASRSPPPPRWRAPSSPSIRRQCSLGGDPIRPRRELVERRRTCDCVRRH